MKTLGTVHMGDVGDCFPLRGQAAPAAAEAVKKGGGGDPTAYASGRDAAGTEARAPAPVSMCHLCREARVSNFITCSACHNSFHWSCVGFYEHLYRKPGPNWRCRDCKEAQNGHIPAGIRAPGSGETLGTEPRLESTLKVSAQLTASGGGTEKACPVCGRGLGRKRTIDCNLCRTPSHAGCVNVRGAETPRSWVCQQCLGGSSGGEHSKDVAHEGICTSDTEREDPDAQAAVSVELLR